MGMIGAAFLIFLFGIYAGRELEARKNSENTRTVRMNALADVSDAPLTSIPESSEKEGVKESSNRPPSVQEVAKTVIVVTPPKNNEPPTETSVPPATSLLASPVILPENESLGKTEVLQKTPSILGKKTPPPPPTLVTREKKPTPHEITPPPSRKPQLTRGSWSVQVHASRDENSARQVAGRLRSQGHAPVVSKIMRNGEALYRVRVGSFATADEARASVARFRREGKFSQAYPVSN